MDSDTIHNRRNVLKSTVGLVGAGIIAGCTGSGSEGDDTEFPSDDIEVIIPFGPGGGYDAYGRLTAEHLSDRVSVDARADNVEGAGGQIGAEEVFNSTDPYTILLADLSDFTLMQITEDVDYDMTEFTPYPRIASSTPCIAVTKESDFDDLEDVINAVQNERVRWGSTSLTGVRTTLPLTLGELGGAYDVENVYGNFIMTDSFGDIITGMQQEDIEVVASAYSSTLPYVGDDGPLEMLFVGIMDDSPPEATPNAQTFSDVDVDNAQDIIDLVSSQRIFMGPPDTPESVAEQMGTLLSDTITSEELQQQAEEIDRPISHADSSEIEEVVRNSFDLWEEYEYLLDGIGQ